MEKQDKLEGLEEHKRLASIVKSVHADLRQKLRANSGDFDSVWTEHCQDESVLELYAQSMKALAKDHWTKNSHTRIEWCRDTINQYFHGGGMKKALEREKKKQQRGECRKRGNKCQGVELAAPEIKPISLAAPSGEELQQNLENAGSRTKESGAGEMDNTEVQLPFEGKIRLLDVGSCYNPFFDFDEFLAVGVDISPATQSVLRCDFLSLETTPPVQQQHTPHAAESAVDRQQQGPLATETTGKQLRSFAKETSETIEKQQRPLASDTSETIERRLRSLESPVRSLPACSFHVVVFSLLLEYLPAAAQRWVCCLRAHEILQRHGLLVIITPDSKSQHRNAPMIRSWRTALEALGFCRWSYVKMEHLHCMAFRKTSPTPLLSLRAVVPRPATEGHREKTSHPPPRSPRPPPTPCPLHPPVPSTQSPSSEKRRHHGCVPASDPHLSRSLSAVSDLPDSNLLVSSLPTSSLPSSNLPTSNLPTSDLPPESSDSGSADCYCQSPPQLGSDVSHSDPGAFDDGSTPPSDADVTYASMMYIPQDFNDVTANDVDEEEGAGGGRGHFEGEEDRQEFFAAVDSELPGFVSEDSGDD